MFIMDFDCYNFTQIEWNHKLLQFPRRWFIFINNILTFTKNLPIWINSRVYLLQKQPPHILTSPYIVLNTTYYQYNKISEWMKDSYMLPMADILDYEHRSNQHGLTINSTGVVVYPRTTDHLLDWRYLDEDAITKHNYLLLHHLMDILNTRLNISWAPSWGTKPPNSTYTYMMGDLEKSISDIAGTIGFMTNDRFVFADYVANPIPTLGKFILKAPPLSAVNNILTMPFDFNVWVSFAVLTVLIVGLMLVTVKWEWHCFKFNQKSAEHLRPQPLEIIQFQIGVVCQQGIEKEPFSLSGKIITFSALLSSLFFYTSYSSCIVALLQSSSTSITTLDDLLNTNIKLGVHNLPYAKFFFSVRIQCFNNILNMLFTFINILETTW